MQPTLAASCGARQRRGVRAGRKPASATESATLTNPLVARIRQRGAKRTTRNLPKGTEGGGARGRHHERRDQRGVRSATLWRKGRGRRRENIVKTNDPKEFFKTKGTTTKTRRVENKKVSQTKLDKSLHLLVRVTRYHVLTVFLYAPLAGEAHQGSAMLIHAAVGYFSDGRYIYI